MKLASMRILSIFFFVVTLGFVAASCSSLNDPAPEGGANAAYVGVWKLVKFTALGEINENPPAFTLDLKSDGSFTINNPTGYPSPSTSTQGTWQASGSIISFTPGVATRATKGSNDLILEWEVSQPGKETTTYRFFFERN